MQVINIKKTKIKCVIFVLLSSFAVFYCGFNLISNASGRLSQVNLLANNTTVSNTNVKTSTDVNSNKKPVDYKTIPNLYFINNEWVYKIQCGDTLSDISAKLNFSVDELAKYNNISDVNMIYTNSIIRIPSK